MCRLTVITAPRASSRFTDFGNAFRPAGPYGASAAAPDPQNLYQGRGSFTVRGHHSAISITNGIQMIVTPEGSGGNENRSFPFRITANGELDFKASKWQRHVCDSTTERMPL